MKILTFDPGVRYTGWALASSPFPVSALTESSISAGTLTYNSKLVGSRRLYDMASMIVTLVAESQPDMIAYEAYGMGGGFFNTEMGELMGMIFALLIQSKYRGILGSLAPNTLKLLVAGSGRAKDSVLAKRVLEETGRKVSTPHERDALALLMAVNQILLTKNKSYQKRFCNFGD